MSALLSLLSLLSTAATGYRTYAAYAAAILMALGTIALPGTTGLALTALFLALGGIAHRAATSTGTAQISDVSDTVQSLVAAFEQFNAAVAVAPVAPVPSPVPVPVPSPVPVPVPLPPAPAVPTPLPPKTPDDQAFEDAIHALSANGKN